MYQSLLIPLYRHKIAKRDGTSKSSSLLGFALSLRESSTAFLKAAV